MDPAAVFVDEGEDADGVEDVPGGEALGVGILDDVSEGELEVAIAQSEKIEGVGVVVDGGFGLEIPAALDGVGAAPLQEGFFDIFAERMVADGKSAGVAFERGGLGEIVWRELLIFGGGRWRAARVGFASRLCFWSAAGFGAG